MERSSDLPATAKIATAGPLVGVAVIVFAAVLIGGWLYVESVRNDLEIKIEAVSGRATNPSSMAPETVAFSDKTDLSFDHTKISIGDRIGTWTVNEINPREVRFSGTATVTGTYTSGLENDLSEGSDVFFRTDEDGASILPRTLFWNWTDEDGRMFRSFTFLDSDVVTQAFGPEGSSGRATVVIRDYVVNVNENETFDHAEFVRRTDR